MIKLTYGVPGMPSTLKFMHTFSETIPNEWAEDFDMAPMGGIPMLNEHVFIHKPSKTLILADLVFNFDMRQKNNQGRWMKRTPAMAAGLADHLFSTLEWLCCTKK